jgi:hypothetical protein
MGPIVRWIRERYGGDDTDADEPQSAREADRRFKLARAERAEMLVERERGRLIDAREATASRLDVVRWAVAVFERAGSELASQVPGKKPAEVKRVVDAYFTKVRERASRNGN